jgi:(p)ppGpp synthase/HD superfamily hydrolase
VSSIVLVYHLLGVASLVIEFQGDEDQAIAGLLHDTIEDCGEPHLPVIREEFGKRVAAIVEACTDGSFEAKADHASPEARKDNWVDRKRRYLAHLEAAGPYVLLVSACDKLHNARAIVQDLRHPQAPEESVFERFTGGLVGTLGYYQSLTAIFAGRDVRVAPVLDAVVAQMHSEAGVVERLTLDQALAAAGGSATPVGRAA